MSGESNVDFALLHRVRKICLSSDKKQLNHDDPDLVLRKLCKNKIYNRKPKGALRKSVVSAIGVLRREVEDTVAASEQSNEETPNGEGRHTNKRPRLEDLPDVMNDGMREKA